MSQQRAAPPRPAGRGNGPAIAGFEIARLPRILFGSGQIARLPRLAAGLGRRALLVTGRASLERKPQWSALLEGLAAAGLSWQQERIDGEPSPAAVDAIVAARRGQGMELVIGIGGGSVIDAAKAVAGLLPGGAPASAFLEGIGEPGAYAGPALPVLAVPTTAGTGSEATRNAVLSERGPGGFKKSFRHDCLVPEYALVDPDLLIGCPLPQMAANAMDALTQLIESYTSARTNPCTDALAESGLSAAAAALAGHLVQEPDAGQRAGLAYAALVSGICLAQTGLGAVHGLAAPLGALFPIPHGVACGATLAAATAVNIEALAARAPDHPSLHRYARIGRWLGHAPEADDERARRLLLDRLQQLTRELEIPRLADYGMDRGAFAQLVAGARGNSMKTNPILLDDAELTRILASS